MFRVEEEKVYEWNISVACSQGEKRSAYLVIILLDKDKKQERRQQRFIKDFSGNPKDYSIVTQIPSGVKYAILAYRVNCEGAVPAHTIIKFPPIKSCSLELSKNGLPPPDDLVNQMGGYFKEIGEKYLSHFKTLGELKPNESFLDVGCGVGRIAVPLVSYLREGIYEGFDINADAISWCKENIESNHSNFHFRVVDLYNKHYNKSGKYKASEFKFPYDSESFDFVSLTSVFTHLLPSDMENYFAEIARVLKKDGRCLITYFLINPESLKNIENQNSGFDFKHQMSGVRTVSKTDPEKAIAYDEKQIKKLYEKFNLKIIEPIHYGSWSGKKDSKEGLDIIIAKKIN